MIKQAMIGGAAGLLLATNTWAATAEQASTQERVGLTSGAVIGGLAGGPLGLVFGAAFGAWLGDQFHDERSERIASEESWRQASAQVTELNAQLLGTERQIQRLGSAHDRELKAVSSTVRDALDVQILFKTGETSLADETSERLARLAALLARMDDMLIRVEGHADARGAVEFNEQLSAQRAAAVRDVLIRAGIPADRIATDAQGERQATAASEDSDAMALERRVQLTLVPTGPDGAVARQ